MAKIAGKAAAYAGRFVANHRSTLATFAAGAACITVALAVCAGVSAAAFAVRAQHRGYRDVKGHALDAGVSLLTFGMVAAPLSAARAGADTTVRIGVMRQSTPLLAKRVNDWAPRAIAWVDGAIAAGCFPQELSRSRSGC